METPFTKSELDRMKIEGYKFIECLGYSGRQIETSEEYEKSEMLVRAHKEHPGNTDHYILEIDDEEVTDMAREHDTVAFYVVN